MAIDIIHQSVRTALEKDDWIITDEPLILLPDEDYVAIDIAAEKLILAEKETARIAVEVKSFAQPSLMYEFHRALGQYFNYQTALMEAQESRVLYLAIADNVYPRLKGNRVISRSLDRMKMNLLLVDIDKEMIAKWIK